MLENLIQLIPELRDRSLTVTPLGGGLTNRNYRIDADGESYVLRVAGKDTALLGIDRARGTGTCRFPTTWRARWNCWPASNRIYKATTHPAPATTICWRPTSSTTAQQCASSTGNTAAWAIASSTSATSR